ncbi:unnamed protein product [Phyllotreta striolata]|uniref:Uncharacterized protein n=1 Tax=Phyllotreta striolata TaxID=444603 RepID=A0A9N9TG20_PHYSR|nr:unnamed protein product [Phyllotreta striolata]
MPARQSSLSTIVTSQKYNASIYNRRGWLTLHLSFMSSVSIKLLKRYDCVFGAVGVRQNAVVAKPVDGRERRYDDDGRPDDRHRFVDRQNRRKTVRNTRNRGRHGAHVAEILRGRRQSYLRGGRVEFVSNIGRLRAFVHRFGASVVKERADPAGADENGRQLQADEERGAAYAANEAPAEGAAPEDYHYGI